MPLPLPAPGSAPGAGHCKALIIIILNNNNNNHEKINKYQDLRVELERLWKMRTSVLPVIIGALGYISQNFDKFVENLTLPSVNKYVLQKSALLGSARIMRQVLQLSGAGLAPELD